MGATPLLRNGIGTSRSTATATLAGLRASGLPMNVLGVSRAGMAGPAATPAWQAGSDIADWELWLDGGHNPGAGVVLGEHLANSDRNLHLIVGMKDSKDAAGFLRPLPHATTVWAVAEPEQHSALPVEAIVAASGSARPGPRVADALAALPRDGGPARVLAGTTSWQILKQDKSGA